MWSIGYVRFVRVEASVHSDSKLPINKIMLSPGMSRASLSSIEMILTSDTSDETP
jgi:hypothetical protein